MSQCVVSHRCQSVRMVWCVLRSCQLPKPMEIAVWWRQQEQLFSMHEIVRAQFLRQKHVPKNLCQCVEWSRYSVFRPHVILYELIMEIDVWQKLMVLRILQAEPVSWVRLHQLSEEIEMNMVVSHLLDIVGMIRCKVASDRGSTKTRSIGHIIIKLHDIQQSDFKYGNTLTRQEAAAFITRYLIEWLGRAEALCKLAYKDMDSIDTSLTPSISRACGLGVMHGNNGYFHPRFGLTRGEALAVLIRAIDQNKQDETVSPWYQGYLNRASVLGLEIASMKSFDEPITRGEFIEWLKALSENKNIGNDEVLLGAWKLERFSDTAGKSYTVVPTNLTFTADRFSIKFCNSMSGNYTAKNGSMTTDKVMSTMMACADDITTMLEWAFDMNGATYSIMMAKVTEGYTGSTEWLNLSTPLGANYTFGR